LASKTFTRATSVDGFSIVEATEDESAEFVEHPTMTPHVAMATTGNNFVDFI
jgi:hypothetical protein